MDEQALAPALKRGKRHKRHEKKVKRWVKKGVDTRGGV